MVQPLTAILVGFGHMGRNHERVLRSTENVSLELVVDPNHDGNHTLSGTKVVDTLDSVDLAAVDIAVVATPTEGHEDVTVTMIRHGIHVLVEKPLSFDSQSGERMRVELNAAGLVGAVGHIERFNPAIREMKKMLEAGELGEVLQISTRRQSPRPSRVSDVGVVLDLATHDIDVATWLVGAEFSSVYGCVRPATAASNQEDLSLFLGTLTNGVIVSNVTNWVSPFKERHVVATGTTGALVANTVSGELTLYKEGGSGLDWDKFSFPRGSGAGGVTNLEFPRPEPLRSEIEGFRDRVATGKGQVVTFSEALRNVVVAEAVISSSHTREVHTFT